MLGNFYQISADVADISVAQQNSVELQNSGAFD